LQPGHESLTVQAYGRGTWDWSWHSRAFSPWLYWCCLSIR